MTTNVKAANTTIIGSGKKQWTEGRVREISPDDPVVTQLKSLVAEQSA